MGQLGHGNSKFIIFLWAMKRITSFGNRILVHHKIVSAVKKVEFVSDGMSYIVLRGRCKILF